MCRVSYVVCRMISTDTTRRIPTLSISKRFTGRNIIEMYMFMALFSDAWWLFWENWMFFRHFLDVLFCNVRCFISIGKSVFRFTHDTYKFTCIAFYEVTLVWYRNHRYDNHNTFTVECRSLLTDWLLGLLVLVASDDRYV